VKKQKQQLLQCFAELDDQSRNSLLDFAQFLLQKIEPVQTQEVQQKQQPIPHPRPEDENVLNAIKRLRASYFMLDTDGLLNQTSSLMTQFMMQGRPANEVIDDLEQLFYDHYQKYLET
jgi:hypothetical protein